MRTVMSHSPRKILYIDPFSGASGDMFLGAFLSLGVPLEVVAEAVERVIPGEVRLDTVPVTRAGLAGLACQVQVCGGPRRRTLEEMLALVQGAGLPGPVITRSLRILEALGEAERKVHGKGDGPVHLHELGGQDTLADVVGAAAALFHLDPDEIHCGTVNLGGGFVKTSHGLMPVPAPATALLSEGMLVGSRGPEAELTTPTGAAILKIVADRYGALPALKVLRVGTGAGTRDHDGFPNLLRMFWGEVAGGSPGGTAVMIECGLDDMSPEYLAPAMDTLLQAGALEVHFIPVHTKKGRTGILLRVLAPPEKEEALGKSVLETTGSPGLRSWRVERTVLSREMITVDTPRGPVAFKRWRTPGGQWRFKPEFEDIRRLAAREGISPSVMRDLAVAAYLSEVGNGQEED